MNDSLLNFAQTHMQEFLSLYNQHPVLIMMAYFIIYIVVAAAAIPGAAVLTMVGGAIFGLLTGTVLVSFASTIGSTLAFLVARFLARDFVMQKYGKQIRKVNDEMEADGAFYLFFLRLNPVIPFFMINTIMGLTRIRTAVFVRVSQLGMLPGTLLYVNAGTQIGQVRSVGDLFSWDVLISFFLLGAFPLAVKKLLKR